MEVIRGFQQWRSFLAQSYAGLFKKKAKRSKPVDDPLAPFGWHSYLYFMIDKLRMSEGDALDYNYIESLNWMSYFHTKQMVEDKENGRLA